MFETLITEVDGALGRLTLNLPDKLNALSPTMLAELIAAARWFDTQPSVKVVIVTGAGRSWSDADGLVTALGDPECAAARQEYLQARGRKRG